MHRRTFFNQIGLLSTGIFLPGEKWNFRAPLISDFAKRLKPLGRALEMKDYYVWGNSPIRGDDGNIHVFFSRWKKNKGMGGWLNGSEICRAVGQEPEGPFEYVETVLTPRKGYFDSTTCHNPTIKKVDGKYCLFYIGCSNGKTGTNRIGVAFAQSLEGPWRKPDMPLINPGPQGAWDDHNTCNPTFTKHPNGQYWLYYKSWNADDYRTKTNGIRGNRKYGLATSDNLEGPYEKYVGNPVIDFSYRGGNAQIEDGYVWVKEGKFKMLARDMGYFNHTDGIILESEDGMKWGKPKIAYFDTCHYHIKQPPAPSYLNKYGRFERPQILFIDGKAAYLYVTTQGGKYMTASSFIFEIG